MEQVVSVLSCSSDYEDGNPPEINQKMGYKFQIKEGVEHHRLASLANSESRGSSEYRSTGISG